MFRYKDELKNYIRTMSKQWMENVPAYFETYLKLVKEDDITEALENTWRELTSLIKNVDDVKANHAYEEGKWTIKEMLLHMIDTERIFQYRSLSIARGEMNELPGFDHNRYVENSKANARTLASIMDEFRSVRNASITLYENLAEGRLKFKGMANGLVVQPVQYGYITSGHVRHHINVIQSRYI